MLNISLTKNSRFSRDLGLPSIILEGDSMQVINVLQANGPNWKNYGQMMEDAKGILGTFMSCQIHHTRRVANSVAHVLAKATVNTNYG